MVRFAATSFLVFWAGTLSHLGTLALQLGLPGGTFTVGQSVPVVWTHDSSDPLTPFSIIQRNLQTNEPLAIFPVLDTVSASGTVLMTFDVPGQITIAGMPGTRLGRQEAPVLISDVTQVTIVQDAGSSSLSGSGSSSSFSSSSSSTTTEATSSFEESETPRPKPKPSSTTEIIPTPTPTTSFSITFAFLPSTSDPTSESVQILTATQPFSTSSFPSSIPSNKVNAASSGGILGGKKVAIAVGVVGAVIGLLLCILMLLHIQRRRARKRLDDFSDMFERRHRHSISPSIQSFQNSSAVSSFVAGESNVGTTQIQTPAQNLTGRYPFLNAAQESTGRYPMVDTAHNDVHSRVPPPISIPKTYLTPPSPHSAAPLILSSPSSSSNGHSSSTSSPYTPHSASSTGSPHTPYSASSTGFPHTPYSASSTASPQTPYSASPYSQRPVPFSPLTPITPQRSNKMQEVAQLQAQRKLLREEKQTRLTAGRTAGVSSGSPDRDSWSMIMNDEPLPRYVSPAASVRLLN